MKNFHERATVTFDHDKFYAFRVCQWFALIFNESSFILCSHHQSHKKQIRIVTCTCCRNRLLQQMNSAFNSLLELLNKKRLLDFLFNKLKFLIYKLVKINLFDYNNMH